MKSIYIYPNPKNEACIAAARELVGVLTDAGATVAVLLPLVSETLPAGVKLPVEFIVSPVNVGWLTVPAGV